MRPFSIVLMVMLAATTTACGDGGPGTISGALSDAGRTVDQFDFWRGLLPWVLPVIIAGNVAGGVYNSVQSAQKEGADESAGCLAALVAFAAVMAVAAWIIDSLARQ